MQKDYPREKPNWIKVLIKWAISSPHCITRMGRGVYISPLAEIRYPHRITLAEDVVLERHSRLCANGKNAVISIGANTTVSPYALLKSNDGKIVLGACCSVNDYAILYGYGGLTIGNNVHIASHVVIVASQHDYAKLETPDFSKDMRGKGIKIEDNVWIGAHAVILDGVAIGTGAVIGAGAVVTKDIPPFSVAVGVPASVIKTRR
ncbi:MAG: acyltransferase [Candidatus Omnitrophota bacterium]|nr:MAG: acyltransferase [Candidatus Omnitrophota bacterium]